MVPLGIELDPFGGEHPTRAEARALLELPGEAFIAGIVGRLDRGKGQEYLLDATALLARRDVPVHVLLVGEETRNERQDYTRALQLKASVPGLACITE